MAKRNNKRAANSWKKQFHKLVKRIKHEDKIPVSSRPTDIRGTRKEK